MKIKFHPRARFRDAFERTDMIIVLAGLLVLASIGYAGLLVAGEKAHRASCRSNLNHITQALLLYSADAHDSFPNCRSPRYAGMDLPWDLSTNLSADLETRGVKRLTWYCPANSRMNNDDHWNFWVANVGKTRVVGYPMLLNGVGHVPTRLQCVKAKGGAEGPPDKKELVLDAVANTGGNYAKIQGVFVDRTSHMEGRGPTGGNISFVDGHQQWRSFTNMHSRFTTPCPGGAVGWEF